MPRLILLNGPPGIGKSTLAQMYVDEHPLALNLDIDRVRALLGRWQEQLETAGLLTREIALAMAGTHLRAGHDVVVPQYLGRLPFIEQLERLADDLSMRLVEIVLMDSRDNAIRRGARVDGALDGDGSMYDRLLLVLDARPHATVVWSDEDKVQDAYQEVLRAIG